MPAGGWAQVRAGGRACVGTIDGVSSRGGTTGWQPLSIGTGLVSLGLRSRTPADRSTKEAAFVRLALTHTAVMAGDAMVTVALAGSLFFSISPTQAKARVALSLLLTMAPFGVVAPFLGPAIDRSRGGRRFMLIASAAGRCGAALYMATVVHSLLLFPAALVLLVLSKAHAVAKSSLVPAAVDSPADLVRANGRLAVLAAIVGLGAAVPAAATLKVLGASWALRLAACVYAVGVVMAVRCRPAPPAEPGPADHIDELARSRGVALAATAMAVLRAVVGFLTFAVAFDFRRTHAPSWWFGAAIGGSLLGGFIGNILGPRVRVRLGEERMILGALGLVAVVALVGASRNSRLGLALLAATVGLGAGMGRLAFDAIVQRDGAEGARGRSFARYEATFQLVWVGAALVPVLVPIPNRVACVVPALGTGVAAVSYVSGRRALHAEVSLPGGARDAGVAVRRASGRRPSGATGRVSVTPGAGRAASPGVGSPSPDASGPHRGAPGPRRNAARSGRRRP